MADVAKPSEPAEVLHAEPVWDDQQAFLARTWSP